MQNDAFISLRLPNEQDFNLMLEIETNPENLKYTSMEKPEIGQIWAFLVSDHDLHANHQIRFVIQFNNQGIGFIDLYEADFILHEAYVGIFLLNQYRNKNLASIALRKLKDYAFLQNLFSLHAEITEDNTVSINFFNKNGFTARKKKEKTIILTCILD